MINETVILSLPKYLPGDLEFAVGVRLDLTFYKPLQKIFSRVILYEYVKRMTEIGVKGINEEIIELVRKELPKYVFWIRSTPDFQESTFDAIRKEGSIVVGWFWDDAWRFDNESKWWIPYLDYCVTTDIEAVPKYKALGARVIHAFPCEGIPIDRDWSNIEEKYDVSFVGTKTYDREQYINELRKRDIPVHLFGRWRGAWWRGREGYVSFEEMTDIFKTTKINLNFSKTHYNKMQIKGRITLVCLGGGFLLTEYVPGIENYFEIDKEIVCFQNAEEMIDKISYYLNHEEERRAIAQAGWKRAINEYTPFHMLSRVFGEIEEDIAAKGERSHPQELKMPRWPRNIYSQYYFQWGKKFLETNYKGLWKDALALSLSYNPFNIGARYYYIIGFLPPFMRPPLFKLYKPYSAAEKVYMRLRHKLLCWADSVPYLRDIKRSVAKRFYYT